MDLTSTGAHGILDLPCATKLWSWMGYQGWSPWRTCSIFFICVHGHRLSQVPASRIIGRPRFGSDGTIASSKGVERILLHCFSRLVTYHFLSGLTEVFFARTMHSTSEFAKMFLSKCVIHAGFVKVAWTLRGKLVEAKTWHFEMTSELTWHFWISNSSK